MKYDFDERVDRVRTNDMKWHPEAVKAYLNDDVPEDMIPMWLADTDFACAPVIIDAIRARADKRIFGYCAPDKDFYQAVCYWQKRRFGLEVTPSWILTLPTVVAGINIAVRTFSKEGDGIIIQQPVYDPFAAIIHNTGRNVVNNGLRCVDGRYEMDFEELERLAQKPENTMMILCSPHNPVGRVWTKEELKKAADICTAHGMMLVSDEIHADIVYDGFHHCPVFSLGEEYYGNLIMLTAPGKTFNVPGLKISLAMIADKEVRERFQKTQMAMSLDIRNTFGLEAVTAAYTPEGEEWMLQEVQYMQENVQFVEQYLAEKMPGVTMIQPEGTFLCWLDMSGTGLRDEELYQKIVLQAGVICVPGPWFGKGGEKHMRLNVGCPRQTLHQALERIHKVLYEGEGD